jgi:hypothetical protein
MSLNLKFKPHNTYNTNQTCNYMARYCLNIVATTVTLGVPHATGGGSLEKGGNDAMVVFSR